MTSNLQKKFATTINPLLIKSLGVKNVMALPKLQKVVINVGLKSGIKDPKFVDIVTKTLTRISGQKPVKTKAAKSISNFKIRQGMVVGLMVTLRGGRMYDFVDKLVNITLPRVRDFRGLATTGIDAHGNFSIGFKDFLAFPEIRSEDTDVLHGLELAIATTAGSRERGLEMFKAMGFPFRTSK